jgi:hypothetical protein
LADVTIGSGLTAIAEYTFAQCPSLISIVIPSNITEIGMSAFIGTYQSGSWIGENLTSITIGDDVNIIGDTFGTARNTFKDTYATNDKAAGTYVFADGAWSKVEQV